MTTLDKKLDPQRMRDLLSRLPNTAISIFQFADSARIKIHDHTKVALANKPNMEKSHPIREGKRKRPRNELELKVYVEYQTFMMKRLILAFPALRLAFII